MNKAQMNSVGLETILDTQEASRNFHMIAGLTYPI